MINFSDVGKTYVSKSKSKVEALKGVSFELGSSGMTFILGKSGSGKSTLLNLLGGLDKPTVGHIEIDGTSMQSFTQADYESYRNSYVGFVFQEFNLLDDFNVKDNVALALQLSKDVNVEEKVIEALKQVELDEEYLTRRVGELSGGEKQRVAIARAIVKNSKMILADEPTGSLDSETGESIWNILKNLSQTRPVIIVSHDRESAEKYADRIIEIADGNIIADNGAEQAIQPTEQKTFTATKQRLSFAMLLKMGFNSLLKRKARTISVILLSMFTVCALLVSQIMVTLLPERSLARHIRLHDVPYFSVGQNHEGKFGLNSHSGEHTDMMRYPTKQYIKQNAQTLDWTYVESKQQLIDFGFEFVGEALELDEKSYYISESVINRVLREADESKENAVILDGQEISLAEADVSAEDLIGKQLQIDLDSSPFELGLNSEEFYTLAGIYKDTNIDLPAYFASDEFEGRAIWDEVYVNNLPNEGTLEIGNEQFNDKFGICGMNSVDTILTEDGIVSTWSFTSGQYVEQISLKDNEVIISFNLLRVMFGGEKESHYIKDESFGEYTVLEIPEILGKTMPIRLSDPETGEVLVDYGECTIKGIKAERDPYGVICYVNETNLKLARRQFNDDSILVKTDSVKNVNSFLVKLRTQYCGFVTDVGRILDDVTDISISINVYGIEFIKEYSVIFQCICLAMAAVTLLLVINLITFSINNRKKEIGILSALGASSWDITKIFVLESLMLSLVIFVLAIAGTFSLVAGFNKFFSVLYYLEYTLTFYVVDIYAILTLFGVCFVVLPLFALLPAIRIARLKPIDAIRVL